MRVEAKPNHRSPRFPFPVSRFPLALVVLEVLTDKGKDAGGGESEETDPGRFRFQNGKRRFSPRPTSIPTFARQGSYNH